MTNRTFLFGVIIGVLLILGLFFFVWQSQQQANLTQFNKELAQAVILLHTDNPQAVEKYEHLVRIAPSTNAQAAAKVDLGIAYLLIDKKKAVQILQEVSANESYPAYLRAGAIIYALGIYSSSQDEQFAKAYIFANNPKWQLFIQGKPTPDAARDAYLWANSLYPTAKASYNIALWYARALLYSQYGQSAKLDGQKVTSYTNEFKKQLQQGDTLLGLIIQKDTLKNDIREYASLQELRGILYDADFILKGKVAAKNTADSSFKLALSSYQDARIANFANTKTARLFMEYYYALFLARLTKLNIENRTADINVLVSDLTKQAPRNATFSSFLKGQNLLLRSSTPSIRKERLGMLTSVDGRLSVLLQSL